MKTLLQQLKERRLEVGFKQNDMLLRVGMSRQQYQHLESKGNPRLDTLELLAKGLNSELMLIPKEKLTAVLAILEQSPHHKPTDNHININKTLSHSTLEEANSDSALADNPWQFLFGDNE